MISFPEEKYTIAEKYFKWKAGKKEYILLINNNELINCLEQSAV